MNNQYPGREKRSSKRLKAKFSLFYQVNKPPTVVMNIGYGREIEALMLDLSEGGMAILTNYNIPNSTVLSIKFILINRALHGDNRLIKLSMAGIVCYNSLSENEEHQLGIRFTQISEKDKKAIGDFIKLSPIKKI
jgi:c-di-GMP-binding flagellar brake protein YcgR